MSTLFNIGNKILASSNQVIDNIEYAPIDGNEFEWNGFTYKVVVRDYDGTKLAWLDRNLGATQVATSSTDADSYGDLYQWGRLTDGHQLRNSNTTSTLSTGNAPGHGDFITNNISPNDWRSPGNNNLWQPTDYINNPAPPGWRLPTSAEWTTEFGTWSSENSTGAYGSPLKLPVAGTRDRSDGSLDNVGSNGTYWSSTVDDTLASILLFNSGDAYMISGGRAFGCSVRCVRDVT